MVSSMKRRVVITGLGAVTPLGNDVAQTWDAAVRRGKCGIGPITLFDPSEYKVKMAGEVKDLRRRSVIDKKEARKMARFTLLAHGGGRRSHCSSSGLDTEAEARQLGVILSSGIGGLATIESGHPRRGKRDGEGQPLLRPHVHREHRCSADRHPLRSRRGCAPAR